MADVIPDPDSNGDTELRNDRRSTAGTPRWVKVIAIIALIVIFVVVVALATGLGGPHGPRRHIPSGDAGDTPPVTLVSHTQRP